MSKSTQQSEVACFQRLITFLIDEKNSDERVQAFLFELGSTIHKFKSDLQITNKSWNEIQSSIVQNQALILALKLKDLSTQLWANNDRTKVILSDHFMIMATSLFAAAGQPRLSSDDMAQLHELIQSAENNYAAFGQK